MVDAKELLQQALALAPEARAALAGALLESLEEAPDPEAESAWSSEIARRVCEVDAGDARLVPWEQARQTLRE
ncbi:MAG: addiction module protein [Planctomycetes bacterium]|jgi:putative addiction module component (TIGR02574 family)|nr:addiction module protein [Planctomycetota bacterium]